MHYGLIDVAAASLAPAVREFFGARRPRLNVTVPHRTGRAPARRRTDAARPARRSSRARWPAARPVPAIRQCSATTPMVPDCIRDLTVDLGCAVRGERVLLLGAGGAARGLIGPLLDSGVQSLAIHNRHMERAQQLVREFADLGPVRAAAFPSDGDRSAPYDLIINAASASLHGELPSVPRRCDRPPDPVLRLRLRRARHGVRQLGAQQRRGPRRDGLGHVGRSKRPNRSCCGAACVPTPRRYCRLCASRPKPSVRLTRSNSFGLCPMIHSLRANRELKGHH